MTALPPRLLFTALTFTSVVGRDGLPSENKADKITALAGFMEAYCRTTVPEAFADAAPRSPLEQALAAVERTGAPEEVP